MITDSGYSGCEKFSYDRKFGSFILIPIGNQTRFVNQTFFLQENEDDTYQ